MQRQIARQFGLASGLVLGAIFAATSPFTGRPLSSIPTPFATAHAKKKASAPYIDPNKNPIDSYVVPLAKPSAPHQVPIFPGSSSPAKFRPPVPTLTSGLSLEEQAAMLEETLPYGLPGVENVLVRKPYILSYNFRTKNANWVAEHHWRENMIGESQKDAKRGDAQFMKDVSIPAIFSQSSGDYLKSGFSRGHLAPAASHSATQEDMQQTFAFTNIIPQNQVMNETDWLKLEKFCRHLPKHYGNVRILSGPMYIPDDRFEYTQISTPVIGSNEVHVPSHLFKVIYLQGKDIVSHCHMHTHANNNSSGCDFNSNILRNAIRFSYPSLAYSPHYKKMFDYITQLPDNSEIKAHLLQSFDWRTRIKHLFTVGENTSGGHMEDIVVLAFIMKNSNDSHGKPLDTYMVKLPYVETLTGLCLTPRQDCSSITMGTWNP